MNILEAIRQEKSVKVGVIITTDKVYLNLEKKKKFKENEALEDMMFIAEVKRHLK